MADDLKRPLTDRLKQNLKYYLPTILIAISVLVIWEVAIIVFNIQQFLLPQCNLKRFLA